MVDASIVFSAGGVNVFCINITIVDDDILEGDQNFTVSLSSDDPVIFDPLSEATVIITDNDSKFVNCNKIIF